jgi:hypothetical protein
MPQITDGRIDGFPVANATLADLDLNVVTAHIVNTLERDKFERGEIRPDDPIRFLERYRCVVMSDGLPIPTMAGILVFGGRPQYFPPMPMSALVTFPATYRARSMRSTLNAMAERSPARLMRWSATCGSRRDADLRSGKVRGALNSRSIHGPSFVS